MKIRQSNNYKQTNNIALMKGVSDSIYLAFISILIIGGTYYIYNDINAVKPSLIISSDANLPEVGSVPATTPAAISLEQKESPVTVEAEKKDLTILENHPVVDLKPVVETLAVEPLAVETPVVAPVETSTPEQGSLQYAPISQPKVMDKVVVENKASTPVINNSSENSMENKAQANTSQEKVTAIETSTTTKSPTNKLSPSAQPVTEKITKNTNPVDRYNRMPMPNMQRMMPPQYNQPMNQAAEYMPNPNMQNPYYGGYQDYRGNTPVQNYQNPNAYNQPYQQRGQQENYQQQGDQYRNTNRPYPEQYTPWNPGRFY